MYTYKDLQEYDEYRRKGEQALPWLPEFEAWLKEYYEVDFLPCRFVKIYQKSYDRVLYNIYPVVMSENETIKVYTKTIKEPLCKGAEYELNNMLKKCMQLTLKYNVPEFKPNDLMRVFHCKKYLTLYRHFYLFDHLPYQLISEISSFFERYNPTYISPEIPTICVLNTKEEARKFLLSEDIQHVKKQIYNLLKPYDEYDVLKKEDIDIFVDYEEHMESISMYSRCIRDSNKEDLEFYKNQIINGE